MAKLKLPPSLPKRLAAIVCFRERLTPVWLTHRGIVDGVEKVVFRLDCGHLIYLVDANQVLALDFPANDLPERLFEAADAHGVNSGDRDYSVGDLQEIVRALWANMASYQRVDALSDSRLQALAVNDEYAGLIPRIDPALAVRSDQPPLPV